MIYLHSNPNDFFQSVLYIFALIVKLLQEFLYDILKEFLQKIPQIFQKIDVK